ncbi:hypothetical protein RYX36_027556 [Vicia faba]
MHSREKSLYPHPQRRRTPSFSSILLDTIDLSIDEVENQQTCLYKNGIEKQRMNLRQAVMIEDWMEKNYTSTSSSECSSGGIFSSSETDSSYNRQRSKTQKHMNLIHCINSEKQQQQNKKTKNKKEKKKKQQGWEDGFTRTKLRALKIYGELNQKVKQPISPGSKIATFLSSIFNSHNVKKAKMCYVGAVEDVSFDHKSKSPCFSSSVSSFSRRSCMSKTTPSKSNNGVKRTVRFYPVSVILGEDPEQQQQPSTVRKSTRNSVEVKKINNVVVGDKEKGGDKSGFDFRRFCDNGEDDDDDDDDDNDAESYSSSDLFELDHLIGGGRFREELPVYETTNLETNKAIANGLCL